MKNQTAILVLAAGQASRMGTPKQLLKIGKTTMLGHCLQTALSCKPQKVFCVLGANSDLIRFRVRQSEVQWIENPEWQEGLGSSIRTGIKHIEKNDPEIEAVLILLGDQPLIKAEDLRPFFQTEDQILAADYDGKAGVPAIFPKRYFSELGKLSGDRGAGKWMNLHRESIRFLPFPPKMDVDTPEDYQQILRKLDMLP